VVLDPQAFVLPHPARQNQVRDCAASVECDRRTLLKCGLGAAAAYGLSTSPAQAADNKTSWLAGLKDPFGSVDLDEAMVGFLWLAESYLNLKRAKVDKKWEPDKAEVPIIEFYKDQLDRPSQRFTVPEFHEKYSDPYKVPKDVIEIDYAGNRLAIAKDYGTPIGWDERLTKVDITWRENAQVIRETTIEKTITDKTGAKKVVRDEDGIPKRDINKDNYYGKHLMPSGLRTIYRPPHKHLLKNVNELYMDREDKFFEPANIRYVQPFHDITGKNHFLFAAQRSKDAPVVCMFTDSA
jgi:hypothetical protein